MPDPHGARRVDGLILWLQSFLAIGLLYAGTANRGAQWQDSGWQQLRIVTGDISHSLGIALTHPVHFYLGRAFYLALPIEPGLAITLLSALAGAIAVANVSLLTFRITRHAPASALAGISLALCHTFWQHATHTESYTLVAAWLTTEWLCIERFVVTKRRRWLIGLFLFNGLGVANHMLAALATPTNLALLVIYIANQSKKWKIALACTAAWMLGCAPLLWLMYRDYQTGSEFVGTIRSTVVGNFAESVFNTSVSWRSIGMSLGFIAYNFPGFAIPLAIYGAVTRHAGFPIALRRVLIVQATIFAVFVLRYAIVDQYSYFFVIYLLIALFAGIGISRLSGTMRPTTYRTALIVIILTTVWTPAVYWTTAKVLSEQRYMQSVAGNKPYRNGYRSMLIPWGAGDDHAAILNQQLIELCKNGGTIVVEDRMIALGIRYAQALGQLAGSVTIVDTNDSQTIRKLLDGATEPIILVPRDRDNPRYPIDRPWRREGDIYVLSK